jgi:chemotaxis protein methyltransferase CheR
MNLAVAPRRAIAPPGPGEIAAIAAIAEADAGIVIATEKASMVQSRLAARLRALGMNDFRAYLDFIESPEGEDERRRMISALTTNVSHFFREAHHFDLLRDRVLPPLIDRVRRGGRIRIWSAGCSRGQEACSIAMTILGLLPDAPDRDVRILATDIDRAVLEEAVAGVYDAQTLAPVAPALRDRYFTPADGGWAAGPALRALVRYRELNLHGTWPMTGPFDAIFCRNVVIYFSAERQAALWPRFARATAPGGWLFVGHSERVAPHAGFDVAGVTAYRRSGGQ